MGKQRRLTAGEIALAKAAFGARIDYDRVKLSDGPGKRFAAHIAFAKGNPAITLGSTVYFKRDYCDDFSGAERNRKTFIHEMTHVWQYQRLGMAKFLLRYGEELAKVGGKPNDMYRYDAGKAKFGGAMLEAQANMVGDYSEALWAANAARIALLAKNMAGSGLYGL
ncbi:MAG TPA: DUF4157 domain-containing protein [Allosphingosinicella sp.]|nr:DUF4157 domain-containing protein [Allosphingosinicella sp.]